MAQKMALMATRKEVPFLCQDRLRTDRFDKTDSGQGQGNRCNSVDVADLGRNTCLLFSFFAGASLGGQAQGSPFRRAARRPRGAPCCRDSINLSGLFLALDCRDKSI